MGSGQLSMYCCQRHSECASLDISIIASVYHWFFIIASCLEGCQLFRECVSLDVSVSTNVSRWLLAL